MWWLSLEDVVAQLGDVMAQFRGCSGSEEDVVAKFRGYGGSV
jgi:hypothetical protein